MARSIGRASTAADLDMSAEALGPGRKLWEAYVPLALAAITALRNPTEAMVEAGDFSDPDDILGLSNRDPDPRDTWRAMIDAALNSSHNAGYK